MYSHLRRGPSLVQPLIDSLPGGPSRLRNGPEGTFGDPIGKGGRTDTHLSVQTERPGQRLPVTHFRLNTSINRKNYFGF